MMWCSGRLLMRHSPIFASYSDAVKTYHSASSRFRRDGADEEVFVAIPGDKWAAVIEKLTETHAANVAMGMYYSNRKIEFAVPGTLTK